MVRSVVDGYRDSGFSVESFGEEFEEVDVFSIFTSCGIDELLGIDTGLVPPLLFALSKGVIHGLPKGERYLKIDCVEMHRLMDEWSN